MQGEKLYRRTINAWCMYDWANSAFVTTIMAAMFPPFYRSLVTKGGLAENTATAYFGGFLLTRVDEDEGIRVARAAEVTE
jgi:UMF1 family MFS transporter